MPIAPQRQAALAEPNRRWFADLARSHGVALATHDDTTPAHVDEARGLGATMSECPTTLAAACHAHAQGRSTIAGAPNVVRSGSHSGNVAAIDLARQGVLSGLSSDDVPGSLLQAAWMLHRDGGFSLPQAVRAASRGPAQAAGLHDRGEIAPGLRADLVCVREVDARAPGGARGVCARGVCGRPARGVRPLGAGASGHGQAQSSSGVQSPASSKGAPRSGL
ncbi:amidohydrolase family protein [Aquabacterium sp. OR-4]|uniref:amidohydrolase family protein n=1 Tax=Aquabacterium sp. OR-4 TaxID=2978127 RepID=UPI0028C70888|nr:amidohydrolase family protein [Aquabacterium sp. OR-4]MDT7838973.1 amidohydrolase family protein [Aquabacterium sp. OR-4]